jgi:hypothetical protein
MQAYIRFLHVYEAQLVKHLFPCMCDISSLRHVVAISWAMGHVRSEAVWASCVYNRTASVV